MTQQTNSKLITEWAPIQGIWNSSHGTVTFNGIDALAYSSGLMVPQGVALSGVRFGNGKIKGSITLPEDPTGTVGQILIGFSSWTSRSIFAGLSGTGGFIFVLTEHVPGVGWRNLSGAGHPASLRGNHPYIIEVGLDGQRLSLMVDGIKVLDYIIDEPVSPEQIGLYAQGLAIVKFGAVEVYSPAYSAFVVMQFTDQFDDLYAEVISPVCEGLNIEAYRASDIYRPGVILQDILLGLDESNVVIAEVTSENPNVFYELGYSHALRKPVILLAERNTPLPFDISGYRVIFYDNTIGGKTAVEADLRRHLTSILGK